MNPSSNAANNVSSNTNVKESPIMFPGTFSHVDDNNTSLLTGDYDTIAKSFAASGFTGRIVRLPDVPEPAVVIPDPATLAVGTAHMTGAAGSVSAVALARQAEIDARLREIGISPTPPVFAAGSRVNATGVDNFRLSRMEYDLMPTVPEAVTEVIQRIAAEKRKDILVPIRDLRMNDDGSITRGTGTLGLERNGLRQLLSRARVFPDAFRVMEKAPPATRAAFFNDMVKHYGDKDELKDARVTVRARINPATGAPQAYAVVGPGYAAFDGDKVIATLLTAFRGADARAEVVYDPSDTSIRADVLYHANSIVDLSAGDVFKGGFRLRTSDDASGAIRGGGLAYRNLCLNLIIIATETSDLFRRIHRGAVGDIESAVVEAAKRTRAAFEGFGPLWGKMRQTEIGKVEVYGRSYSSVTDALTGLVDSGKVDLAVARDTAVEWLLAGYDAEPGDSLADLLNAVTRVHSLEKVPAFVAERAEDAAGILMRDLGLSM